MQAALLICTARLLILPKCSRSAATARFRRRADRGSTIAAPSAAPFSPVPAALDVFAGAAFIASNQSPYLEIYKGSLVSYANGFHAGDPINALDVARDETTGRVYAYAAAASTTQQLMVIDVTDSSNPVEVARLSLAGVDPARVVAARVAHRILRPHYIYDDAQHRRARAAYHQCCRSRAPVEIGSGLNLGTSAYAITVRDERVGAAVKRFAYLATTLDSGRGDGS